MFECFDIDLTNASFEWDEEKDRINFMKHGIHFRTAVKVFLDPKKMIREDEEHPEDAEFIVDEVWMQAGELHAKAIDEDGDEMRFRLYPIGEDEFGRKGGMLKLTFNSGCVMYDDFTCKKL